MSDPIFYRKPVALSSEAHGAKRFRHLSDYGFARDSNAVPVGAGEMALAARHYPLVFAATAPVGIVAILGIETGKNLFVDAAGKWAAELYVPAFVRRYPFAFAEREDQLILCIDEAAETLHDDEGQYLFNADGTTTPFIDKVVEFNREFHVQARAASAFAAAADAQGLLTDNRAEIETRGGRKAVLGGFRVIERAKYDALPDDVFLEWRKAGWLDLAAAHFLSMESWHNLLART
jgi:hypothetical protein